MRDPVFGSCPEIQMVQGGRVRSEESHHQRRIVVVYCAVRKRFKARKWRRCDAVVYMHQERRALCPHIESFLGNVVLVVQLRERREEREERGGAPKAPACPAAPDGGQEDRQCLARPAYAPPGKRSKSAT